MRVTSIGHAGFVIDTTGGSILCDPWFTPTYFGSWYPFPRNDELDLALVARPDYLYVSHAHRDHLDPEFLAQHVSKDATVLLPDFGVNILEGALRDAGFTKFLKTQNEVVHELEGGLKILIKSLAAPHVGPMGDSLLIVADETAVVLNQNDAHPEDLEIASTFGPVDAHLLQYSGAIWYPMVYELGADDEADAIDVKRQRQTARAIDYVEMVNARHVVPSAGPPCFLDEELFHLNDLEGEADSIFPDAFAFLSEFAAAGHEEGRLLVPGSTLKVGGGQDGTAVHAASEEHPFAAFLDKRAYLERYQSDMRSTIEAQHRSWPTDTTDLLSVMKAWLEPILLIAKHTRRGIGAPVMLTADDGLQIVIDMGTAEVRAPKPNEECPFRFATRRSLLESSVRRRVEDWCNELFLSCRFTAYRAGKYNEFLYTFFKSLSVERMRYAESFYEAQLGDDEVTWAEVDGWVVERSCPHQAAALVRFGSVCDNVLTCGLHGWEYELPSGNCITTEGVRLRVKGRVEHPAHD